jgi:hypothetical protein
MSKKKKKKVTGKTVSKICSCTKQLLDFTSNKPTKSTGKEEAG